MKRAISGRFALGVAGAAMVWMGLAVGMTPARAFDDKPSTFEPIFGAIGLGKSDDEKPDIDFRERPKLVVPKSNDLPTPTAGADRRGTNWPADPDVKRRREAAAAARAPRGIEVNKNPLLSAQEMKQDRSAEPGKAETLCPTNIGGVPDCSVITPADKLKQVFSLSSKDDDYVPGKEPGRTYLTEPPSGYRAPRQVVKATTEKPARAYEAPSAADYSRGVNPNKVDEE